ncbi:MAG: 2-phospho-L-lactate transferase CofD family protein, partial [Solimonas sp.]
RALRFDGAERARLAPALRTALADPALAGVIVCPSNPYLSVAPMLAVRELRETLATRRVPVVAVSPIVAGEALKGPAAKIMRELGVRPHAGVIAELYADFVDTVLIDTADAVLAQGDARLEVAPTVMRTDADRAALARRCVAQLDALSPRTVRRA